MIERTSPTEDHLMTDASQKFVAQLAQVIATHYPGFGEWDETAKVSAMLILAAQMLLRPETYATNTLNLDHAAHGFGIALGNQTGAIPDEGIPQMVNHFLAGFNSGRSDRNRTVFDMPVSGSA